MRQILVTGANGNLGGCLVKELADNTEYGVLAVVNDKAKLFESLEREKVLNRNKVTALDQEEFFLGNHDFYACVHMAFSRANKPCRDIAASLDYTNKVFSKVKTVNNARVIYISSQSVYGSSSEWRTETCEPAPEIVYSMAKYAGEKLLEASEIDSYSILRLDYVIQSQRLVAALCKSVKEEHKIYLKGGKQTFSYIDRTDVAKAVIALLNRKDEWKHIYNVGPNRMRYSLLGIAEVVKLVAENHGVKDVTIDLIEDDTELWSGMDSSLFMTDTGWTPAVDIYNMVEMIYEKV